MAAERGNEEFSSTVLWRIENINMWYSYLISERFNMEISSPSFSLNNIDTVEWVLSASPDEDYCIFESIMTFRLCPSGNSVCISLDCEWSILGNDGSPILTSFVSEETSSGPSHHMPNSPTWSEMFEDKRSLFVPNDTLMVRLRVRETNEGFDHVEHVSLVTQLQNKALRESFLWRIQRFPNLQLDNKVETTVCMGGIVFKMMVFLSGESLHDSDINFGIVTESGCEDEINVRIFLLGNDGRETKCVGKKHLFSSIACEEAWVIPKIVSRREILLDSLGDGGDLTLRFKFRSYFKYFMRTYIEKYNWGPKHLNAPFGGNCSSLKNYKTTQPRCPRTIISIILEGRIETTLLSWKRRKDYLQQSTSMTALSNDSMSLFKTQTLSDFQLCAVDGVFPVHKNILSARSPVFKVMFCGDMKEAHSNSLYVPDVDGQTLGMFLAFLYSGTMDEDLDWESAAKLYYTADKYEVFPLKQRCSSILQSNITLSNVSDILELADRHQDQDLTAFVLDFIENNFDAVILSEEWDCFLERNYLAGKTMKQIYRRRNYMKTRGDIWHRHLKNDPYDIPCHMDREFFSDEDFYWVP